MEGTSLSLWQETTVTQEVHPAKTHWKGNLGPSFAKHSPQHGKELESVYGSTLNTCDDLRPCNVFLSAGLYNIFITLQKILS